ncbi:hypothetical protein VNI00_005013 [Paramarasmius palmivorus]|uniref:Uncharacterized protein n=1 Tax=Paramarasmius palmivorus TaxID=297713 RepID=A0AAW0DEE6_9AGAR
MFTFGISPKAILYVPFMFATLISAVILAFVSRLGEPPNQRLARTSSWVEDVKDSFRAFFAPATVLIRSYTTNCDVTFVGLSVFIYSFVLSIYETELEARELADSIRKLVPIIRFASYAAIIPTILFFNRERSRPQERATSEITLLRNIVYFQIACAMIALVIPTSFDYILVGVYLPTLVSGFMPLLYTIGSVYYGGERGAAIGLYSALTVAQSLGEWLPSVHGLVSEASNYSSYTIELVHVACLVAVALLLLFSRAPEETTIHAANNGE